MEVEHVDVVGTYSQIQIPYIIFVLGSICIISCLLWKERSWKNFMCGLFIAYCLHVVYFGFFSTPLYIGYDNVAIESLTAKFGVHPFLFKNLIPFRSFFDQLIWEYYDSSVLLNVIFTVPLGVFIVIFETMNHHKILIRDVIGKGMLFSLGIESTQLLLNMLLGYRYRIVTIDDVIMNTIGTVLGGVLVIIGINCWKRIRRSK